MKISISNITYIFLLLSFLAGYFEYMFIFLLIVIIHEMGHFFFSYIVNFKFEKIIVYPFGGITIYNENLNVKIIKEIFTLLGGISFQITFYILILHLYSLNFVGVNTFNIFKSINYLLISFNFLPILPLDGGKLINLVLDYFFPYKVSNYISIVISILFIIVFLIKNTTFYSYILLFFLIKSIVIEIINIKYKYNKFLLERYLYNYKFNKIKIINNINRFRREYYHIINNKFEKETLKKLFDTSA